MTADQSPDLVTALREGLDDLLADSRYKFTPEFTTAQLMSLRGLIPDAPAAHPTPAQTPHRVPVADDHDDELPGGGDWYTAIMSGEAAAITPRTPTPAQSSEQEVVALREELAAFRAECDAVGVPYDAAGLVRHWKGNAALTGAMNAMAEWESERRDLLARLAALPTALTSDAAVEAAARALDEAAAAIYNGAGDPEQEFYDHGVSPWLSARAEALRSVATLPTKGGE